MMTDLLLTLIGSLLIGLVCGAIFYVVAAIRWASHD